MNEVYARLGVVVVGVVLEESVCLVCEFWLVENWVCGVC